MTGLQQLTRIGKDVFYNFAGPVHMSGDLEAMTSSFVPRQTNSDSLPGIHFDSFYGQWMTQFESEICGSAADTAYCLSSCTIASASNGVDTVDDSGAGVGAGGKDYPPASITLIPTPHDGGDDDDDAASASAASFAGTYHLTQCNKVFIGNDDPRTFPAYLRAGAEDTDGDNTRFALRFYGWLKQNNDCTAGTGDIDDSSASFSFNSRTLMGSRGFCNEICSTPSVPSRFGSKLPHLC